MTAIKLSALRPGDRGVISALHSEEELYYRLAALGFRVGRHIELIRSACFHGPLQVRIGSTDIILRRREAHKIDILPAA